MSLILPDLGMQVTNLERKIQGFDTNASTDHQNSKVYADEAENSPNDAGKKQVSFTQKRPGVGSIFQ